MILADTDVLSAFAKIERLPLLYRLFDGTVLQITAAVSRELEYSFRLGRDYAVNLFDELGQGRIETLFATPEEAAFGETLPTGLGTGERESIAVAKHRSGVLLSNESRVAHVCGEHQVPCLRIPDILRALWVGGVITKQDVEERHALPVTRPRQHALPARRSGCHPG